MNLGVCYYPEHWPASRWAEDARLMRQAGLSLVRIGEFAWAKMEPAEGQFEWAWLDQAIETLAAAGLKVVLGTPTATPPAWLCRADPEILPVDAQGRTRRFGSRRHYCPNSPAYRRHTERIVTAMAQRYGSHPALAAWQIDNEFGCHDTARCYCDNCARAFRIWLQNRYRTLAALNDAWGAEFWSQTYSAWDQIDPPNLTVTEANPSHVLDYYRFSSDSVVGYQQLQLDLLRRHAPGRPITTNFMGTFTDLDYHDLARSLDFVSWDSYPTGSAELGSNSLYMPGEPRPPYAYDLGDPLMLGFCHDLTRGLKRQPFWVMEQQCGNINWSATNTGVRPGALRIWTWLAALHDAEAVLYFRWRACLFAQEQMHSGLLKHDATPDTGYTDLMEMQKELPEMQQARSVPWQADAALLLDYSSLWALQLQPHRREFSDLRHLFLYYRALARLGVPVDVVEPGTDLSRYKLVIAPTRLVPRKGEADHLMSYLQGGGHLLLGVRSGFKTPTNVVTRSPLPGIFRQLVGAQVRSWHALPGGVSYPVASAVPGLGGEASFWAEALQPEQGVALAEYTAGPFAGQAALVKNALGKGFGMYMGWYPNPEQALALVSSLCSQAGVETLPALPEGLAAVRRGERLALLNFTEEPLTWINQGRVITVNPRDLHLAS